jgi:hypothetical protein
MSSLLSGKLPIRERSKSSCTDRIMLEHKFPIAKAWSRNALREIKSHSVVSEKNSGRKPLAFRVVVEIVADMS